MADVAERTAWDVYNARRLGYVHRKHRALPPQIKALIAFSDLSDDEMEEAAALLDPGATNAGLPDQGMSQ